MGVKLTVCDGVSITELKHALGVLNAQGIGLLTNHEGLYLGHPTMMQFFAALNGTKGGPHVCFVHPAIPLLRGFNGTLIEANPSEYFNSVTYRRAC